jgi:hypothetical protein
MGTKRQKAKASEPPPRVAEESELPERWSAQRKTELALRLLRGEALDAVSVGNLKAIRGRWSPARPGPASGAWTVPSPPSRLRACRHGFERA